MKHDYSTNISGTDDCCGNCLAYRGYYKVPKCKTINEELGHTDFRPIPQGICPKHKRAFCYGCNEPIHSPLLSYCESCTQEMIDKENEAVLVNVITGEVVGKRKDIAPIRSEFDLF